MELINQDQENTDVLNQKQIVETFVFAEVVQHDDEVCNRIMMLDKEQEWYMRHLAAWTFKQTGI